MLRGGRPAQRYARNMDRKRKLDVNPADLNGLGGALTQPNKGLNPYTGRPYSQRYYDILQKRTGELMRRMIPLSEHDPPMGPMGLTSQDV